jgi:WhiB family redox-sensing transcriptional regulator
MIIVHVCKECGEGFFDHPRRGMCHRCFERERKAGNVPGLVGASRARAHIEALVGAGAGWNYREIARAAGIDRSLIAFIVNGRERINADTAFRICCVDPLRRLDYKAPPETVEHAKARGRKAADAQTPEQRRARGLKAWETRRAKAAAAEAVSTAGHSGAGTAARRVAQHRRWAAELEQRRLAKAQRAETDRLLLALRTALFGDQDEDWRDQAICAQIDPDLFFPEKGGSSREAKKICLSCTVREECLAFALENEERFGVFGGLSERERRRMVKTSEQESA